MRDTLKKYNVGKLKRIIHTLIDATKSGYCEWTLKYKSTTKDNSFTMQYKSDDGETIYQLSLDIHNNGSYKKSTFKHIWIYNKNIPDNGYDLFSGWELNMEREFSDLFKTIYNDFLLPHVENEIEIEESVMDNILKNVSKGYIRKKKLSLLIEKGKKENDLKGVIKKKPWWKFWKKSKT